MTYPDRRLPHVKLTHTVDNSHVTIDEREVTGGNIEPSLENEIDIAERKEACSARAETSSGT